LAVFARKDVVIETLDALPVDINVVAFCICGFTVPGAEDHFVLVSTCVASVLKVAALKIFFAEERAGKIGDICF
jgi:hypothetical protein